MREDLHNKFAYYFDEFRKDEQVNTKIKKLILENLGLTNDLDELIDEFLSISIKCQYTYSIGLGYAMKFWCTYGKDIDKAIAYNEKARSILMSLKDYEKQEGILTVANNAVLANIFKEDYGAAYHELSSAMPIAEKEERITYYSAFLNNGATLLSELGLYEKAIEQVEETLEKRDMIGESNYYITIFLLSNLYLSVHDAKKAKQLIIPCLEALEKNQYFDYALFQKQLIECAVLEDDKKEAQRIYDEVVKRYDYENNVTSDNCEVYMTLARYFMYMEDYDKAETYYLLLQQNMNHVLGNKRRILAEMGSLYAKKKNYEKAYAYQQQAYMKSVQYDKFVDDLYRKEKEDVWEKNRMLSYEVLYKRLLKVSEAGRYMSATLTWNQLLQKIKEHMPQIFQYQQVHLIIVNSEQSMDYISETGEVLISEENMCHLLSKCAKQGKSIYIEDTSHSDEFKKLQELHISTVLMEPIMYHDQVVGIFYLDSEQRDNFSKYDRQLLHVICDYLGIAITNIRQYIKAVEKSSYDYLTSTYNRGGLVKQGEEMLLDCKAQKKSVGALMIDIDDFKNINDQCGHMHGDEVIKMVTIIMDKYKAHGIIARFGGEEFTLLIDGISQDELYHIAENIRHECETTPVVFEQMKCSFTISIGCSYQSICDIELLKLLDDADQKLYIAKNNGKNYVQM